MKDIRPWKIVADGCFIQNYKSKNAAIKRAKILKKHTLSNYNISVSSAFEVIDIN